MYTWFSSSRYDIARVNIMLSGSDDELLVTQSNTCNNDLGEDDRLFRDFGKLCERVKSSRH